MTKSRRGSLSQDQASGGRELVFSVTLKDCDVQTFRCGGHGGQNVNKRDTGVRIVHRASGAVGEARDERQQLQNKKLAWRRMVASGKFRVWVNRQLLANPLPPEEQVKRDMHPSNLLIMEQQDGKWKLIS